MEQDRPPNSATRWSKYRYYARSVAGILGGFREPAAPVKLLVQQHLLRRTTPRRVITHRSTGLRFEVRSFLDVWCLKETLVDRMYERYGFRVQPGWVVVDVGAAAGDYAVAVAKVDQAGRVLAFEPSPESYGMLVRNLTRNGARNVEPINLALSDQVGTLLLDVSGDPVSMGTLTSGQQPRESTVRIAATTLEKALRERGIERCDLLKLDCEGGEYAILASLDNELLRRIDHIVMEYHDVGGRSHREIVERLEAGGYDVRVVGNPVHRHLGYLAATRR
ncbi:MAG: FkbM family methyltransferase [Candidatus Dormibacteria bacterium]